MTLTPRMASAWQAHGAGSTQPATLRAELTRGTIPGIAATTAAHHPNWHALSFPDGAHTQGQLDTASARLAGWLADQGVRHGDRVLLCGPNSLRLVTAYLAILRLGGIVVPANPAYSANELGHLVSDSGATTAFASHPALDLLGELPVRLISLEEELPEANPVPIADVGPMDTAMLAYTSGTTGAPKGVPLTHGNLLSSIRGAMLAWQWTVDDVLVHALPLSHQHGLSGVHATLVAGSSAVVLAEFDPEMLSKAAVEHSATVLFAVPSIYHRLVADEHATRRLRESPLRLAVSGSAPLSASLADSVTEATGLTPLERYGSTEAGLDVSNPLDGPRKIGTVGLPLPGTEILLADSSGAEVGAGEQGEVLVRGPQVFSGYWNRPEATVEAFHGNDWFRTGDLGTLDEDGYLQITGRLKELIITGGMNVYPREVELALEHHDAVAAAAVAGLPSEQWGEQVTAWVVPEPACDVDPHELIAHAKHLLAGYKCPKQVFLSDSLPRNSMGKLQRRALVEAATDPAVDTTTLDKATAKLRNVEL